MVAEVVFFNFFKIFFQFFQNMHKNIRKIINFGAAYGRRGRFFQFFQVRPPHKKFLDPPLQLGLSLAQLSPSLFLLIILLGISLNKLECKHGLHTREIELNPLARIRSLVTILIVQNWSHSDCRVQSRTSYKYMLRSNFVGPIVLKFYRNCSDRALSELLRSGIVGTVPIGHRRNCSDSV